MCGYNLEWNARGDAPFQGILQWGNMNTRQNSQAILDYDLLAPVSFLGIGFYFSWVYASFFGTSFFVSAASPMANASITTVISLAGLLSVFGASFFAYRVIDLFTKAPLYIVGSIVASVCTLTGFFGAGNAFIFYASRFSQASAPHCCSHFGAACTAWLTENKRARAWRSACCSPCFCACRSSAHP